MRDKRRRGGLEPKGLVIVMLVLAVGGWLGAGEAGARVRPKSTEHEGPFVQVGEASWYGRDFHGRRTASGERFDMYELTAAHRTLPFGTMVRVTNLENGKEVIVRINDRGPFIRGRIIDLSYGAAGVIGLHRSGVARVKIEVLDEAYWEEERLRKEYESYDRDSVARVIQKSAEPPYVEEGLASFNLFKHLSRKCHQTAEMDTELTASHHTLPLGTRVKVTNLKNGKSVIVKICDRCEKSRNRIMILSREAAQELEMLPQLVTHVRIEVVS